MRNYYRIMILIFCTLLSVGLVTVSAKTSKKIKKNYTIKGSTLTIEETISKKTKIPNAKIASSEKEKDTN